MCEMYYLRGKRKIYHVMAFHSIIVYSGHFPSTQHYIHEKLTYAFATISGVIILVASDPIIKMNEITSIGISGMASLNSFHSEGVDVANGGAPWPSIFSVVLRFFFIVDCWLLFLCWLFYERAECRIRVGESILVCVV